MYTNDDDGVERESKRDISMESQFVLGIFLMFAFTGLVWFMFAGR